MAWASTAKRTRTRAWSEETRAILRLIHERTEFSSWRCPHTVAYLHAALPELTDRCLMTGCPVVYDQPLLEGQAFHDGEASVAVTVTERGDFWARESKTLAFVAKRFPRARRHLVLHENFSPPSALRAGSQPPALCAGLAGQPAVRACAGMPIRWAMNW